MLIDPLRPEIVLDSFMLITYEICQPKILIHSSTSDSAIICPDGLLYLGVRTFYTLCIHNASNVTAHFLWGNPIGEQVDCVQMEIYPHTGTIKPHKSVKVTVSLTPQKTGIIEYAYLPCFIGRLDEPIIVTVMCAVDNVHLIVFLPTDNGRYKEIMWPPNIIDEYNYMLPTDEQFENVVSIYP